MTTAKKDNSASGLKAYERPELKVFGSLQLLTQGASGSVGDGSGAMFMIPSDPRVKENIVEVGRHPLGFGLYLFDYKPEFQARNGSGRKFGVMADEVEGIVPEAVSFDDHGYRRVNYSLLGIRLDG